MKLNVKKLNLFCAFLIALILVCSVSSCGTNITENKENEEWKECYSSFLASELESEKSWTTPHKFNLLYIDNDDIPELMYVKDYGHLSGASLYTCENGELKKIIDSIGSFGNFYYSPEESLFFGNWSGFGRVDLYFYRVNEDSEAVSVNWLMSANDEGATGGISVYRINDERAGYDDYMHALNAISEGRKFYICGQETGITLNEENIEKMVDNPETSFVKLTHEVDFTEFIR